MNHPSILAIISATLGTLQAGPRTSADYAFTTDVTDAAGAPAASADYSNSGSAGGITGISSVAAPAETDKAGYLAQLADPASLTLTAPATSVTETQTLQLGATLVLDDSSTLVLDPANVAWSSVSQEVSGITNNGLLTTAAVYQDTIATASGNYLGTQGTFAFTVVNTWIDNFGTYAGDELDDAWQVQYFGIDNPDASPTCDPDHDGYANLFEYNALLVPTDPLSTFSISVIDMPGGSHGVMFQPVFPGCTYIAEDSDDLLKWKPMTGTVTDKDKIRIVDDDLFKIQRHFYRISVHRP